MMKSLLAFFAIVITSFSGCTAQGLSQNNPNVILITIDTLRADHLSCYGYERETSPNIDKIAEKGILFKNVIAPSPWTAPSMVSLFTSTYPINHGVVHALLFMKKREKGNQYSQAVFSDELATLPQILKKQGYTTFGVPSNDYLMAKFGFARGFDYFKYVNWQTADQVNKIVYSWEDKIKKSGKYFLWVHYIDPHCKYHSRSPWVEHYTTQSLTDRLNLSSKTARELNDIIPSFNEMPEMLANLVALYDSEINYVDSYVGELIQRFDLDKNTLLIITSDHGEQFLEHGRIGHEWNLYQEEINVPLIIKMPDASEMVTIENQTSLLDVLPTILSILDTDLPKQVIGKVLLKGKEPLDWLKTMLFRRGEGRHIFAELDTKSTLKTIITPDWKYICDYKNKTDQLYSIKSDHNELNNLADKNPKRCTQLKKELLNWVATSKSYPIKRHVFDLSQKENEKLEALGYLDARAPEQKQSQKGLVKKRQER